MKSSARSKSTGPREIPVARAAQPISALTQFLSRIDPRDRNRWPDQRIGETLVACSSIRAAELRGQTISEATLEIVSGMFDGSEPAQPFDPTELREAMEAARRKAPPESRMSELGAAFREALLYRADAAIARNHRSALKVNSQKGVKAWRLYNEEDHAKWRRMAAEMADKKHSKRRRAELIAQELKLPSAAVSTICKKI